MVPLAQGTIRIVVIERAHIVIRGAVQGVGFRPLGVPKLQVRTAFRTGCRLRMEPAVKRVVIFFAALRTHCEGLHRGLDTIVREGIDDRKTRATVCAVGKRVEVAAIVGIEYITQTILASRDVRQNQSQVLSLMIALTNLKTPEEKRVQAG